MHIEELEGKTIKKAWKEQELSEDWEEGDNEEEKYYDDERLLFLEMTDGTLFKIRGGFSETYTGKSRGEYPAFISIEEVTQKVDSVKGGSE